MGIFTEELRQMAGTYGRYFAAGTFFDTGRELRLNGRVRRALSPDEESLERFREIYKKAGSPETFERWYSSDLAVYSAGPEAAIQAVSDFVSKRNGRRTDLRLGGIGACLAEGVGIAEPVNTLFLYKITDSSERVYLLLTAGLSMLEVCEDELKAAGLFDGGLFDSQGVSVDCGKLDALITALAGRYFKEEYKKEDIIDGTDILPMVRDYPDYLIRDFRPAEQKLTGREDRRIAMLICIQK
ncbi:MAG: hypothetical protein IJ806_09650 [Ruminococcus sp.]|nr:hypothetical protein [Ruminococcus sp.]